MMRLLLYFVVMWEMEISGLGEFSGILRMWKLVWISVFVMLRVLLGGRLCKIVINGLFVSVLLKVIMRLGLWFL